MSLKAITVNTAAEAEPHIYAQDDAAIYQSIVGSDGVFNIGNKFAASILSNNSVRVSDGVLCVGGHIARTAYADYQDMTIENGESGKNRNDIIVAKFQTSGSVDTLTLEVKKGTPGSAATDPALTQNNLYQGGTVREYPLWRVKLEGLSITDVEQMYTEIPTIPELQAKIDELNTNLTVSGVDVSSVAPDHIAVNGYLVKQQCNFAAGYVYFRTTAGITNPANLISFSKKPIAQYYVPIYNLSDKQITWGTLETNGYLKNAQALESNKVYLINMGYFTL